MSILSLTEFTLLNTYPIEHKTFIKVFVRGQTIYYTIHNKNKYSCAVVQPIPFGEFTCYEFDEDNNFTLKDEMGTQLTLAIDNIYLTPF